MKDDVTRKSRSQNMVVIKLERTENLDATMDEDGGVGIVAWGC